MDFGVRGRFAENAPVEVDLAGPVEGVVGGDHLERVPAVGGFVAGLAVRAPRVAVGAGFLELELELFGVGDGRGGGAPVLAYVAAGVDAFAVAAAGELGDFGEDADAAAGEAHDAVDLECVFLVFGVVGGPVVAAEERLVVLSAAETAEYVEIGEPAAEEIGDAIFASDRAGSTASKEHSTSYV